MTCLNLTFISPAQVSKFGGSHCLKLNAPRLVILVRLNYEGLAGYCQRRDFAGRHKGPAYWMRGFFSEDVATTLEAAADAVGPQKWSLDLLPICLSIS